MKEYIEQVLHQNIHLSTYTETSTLPLVCKNAFALYIMQINKQKCLLAVPTENMNLTELRKYHRALERYTGYFCALYLKNMNYYTKEKMLEEGIPFVWENHQVYLPFLGILLNQNDGRTPRQCEQISFLTQKLLLKALYENWQAITVTKAAELLQVSKMSVTRCFDEIEFMEMPFLQIKNRARKFHAIPEKKKMWEMIQPFLRNPMIAEFYLDDMIEEGLPLSGISALAEYSLLGEEPYPTYAVTKKQLGQWNIRELPQVPRGETPVCVVQEVGYILPFGNNTAIDPLSLVLMLSETELEDPRIELSVKEMLEEFVW